MSNEERRRPRRLSCARRRAPTSTVIDMTNPEGESNHARARAGRKPVPRAAQTRVLGDEVFQRTVEDLIRSSMESGLGVFLSGKYARRTPYLVVCLTAGKREHIRAAQELVEHALGVQPEPRRRPLPWRLEARLGRGDAV